jgi:uncharacterized membrane protein YqjE
MRAIIRKLLALIVFAAAVLLLLNSVAAVLLSIGKVGRIWFVRSSHHSAARSFANFGIEGH